MSQYDTHNYAVEHFQRNLETLAKGASINVIGIGVRAVLVYAHGIIVARMVGVSSYGVYTIAFSIFSLLLLGGQMGMDRAIVRYVSEYQSAGRLDRAKTVLIRSLQLSAGGTLLAALALYISANRIAQVYASAQLTSVLRYFALALPVGVIAELLSAFTQAFRAMRFKFIVQDFLRPSMELVLGIALVLLGFSVAGLAMAYAVAALAGVLLLWRFASRLGAFDRTLAGEVAMRPVILFALPVLAALLMRQASVRVNVLAVGGLMDEKAAGAFNAASQTVNLSTLFANSVTLIFAPIASALYHSQQYLQLEEMFQVLTRWMLMLSLPIFMLAGYLAVPVLRMFGPGFDVAAPAMAVLAAGQLVNVSIGTAGMLLTMSDRTYLNAINTAAALALGVLLAFTLIPRYGLLGAAIAQAATMALVNAIRLAEVWLVLKMKPYTRSYLKPVLAGAVGGVLGLVGHSAFASNGQVAQRVAGTCLLLVGYAVALLLQKVEPEERALWRSLWGRIGRVRSERHQAG